MKVKTIKNHSPDGGKRYKVGDVYEVSASSARVLVAFGFVEIVDPKQDSKTEERSRYKRRDLRAEH